MLVTQTCNKNFEQDEKDQKGAYEPSENCSIYDEDDEEEKEKHVQRVKK